MHMLRKTNKMLFDERINIIWGTGNNGKWLSLCLLNKNIYIDMFCDSDPQKQGLRLFNKKVVSPEEALKYKENANFIISTCREEDTKQIVEFLKKNNISNYITADELSCYKHTEIVFDIFVLFKIVENTRKKEIIIYGTEQKAWQLRQILELMDLSVKYLIDDIEEEYKEENIFVKPVYDLLEESTDSTFIILTGSRDSEKGKILERIGFRFYYNYNYIEDFRDNFDAYIMDPNLGYNYILENENYPGIVKWGRENSKIVIATLGGSTTDGYGYKFKSWPQILYELLQKNGYDVTVINAGASGYRTAQELIKLERDVLPFQPHIVLNYTSYNDSVKLSEEYEKFPFVHLYHQDFIKKAAELVNFMGTQKEGYTLGVNHGLRKEENCIRNIRMMKSICEEFNVKYHCFLQPNLFLKKENSRQEKEIEWHIPFGDSKITQEYFYKNVKSALKNKEYVSDITWLFDCYDDIYLDCCHVTEKGNEIIAEYMYNFLIKKGWLLK